MNTLPAQPSADVLTLHKRPSLSISGKALDTRNGHETILRTLIKKRQNVTLRLLDGTEIDGRISQFDKFTITIWPTDGKGPETFFKHSLVSFCGPEE